jgi:hypothetical protein
MLDAKVEVMTRELNRMGAHVDSTPLPDLEVYGIDPIENTNNTEENNPLELSGRKDAAES